MTHSILTTGMSLLFITLLAIEQPEEKPMSLEEVDVARHREITSKAVSAILLLLLKWFKASRKYARPLPPRRSSTETGFVPAS